jgi:DNA excision repair protein ERCC-2
MPQRFYADTLGLPPDTAWLEVDAPFEASQLAVRIVRDVSTRWRHRGSSLAPIADLLARQYAEQPGNYLAFFSSFEYLQQAAAELEARHPGIPAWQQTPRMDDAGREAFLARFVEGGRGIGFAVLGGVFAEGIDLPGRRLIGAFIATLGLPQVNPLNEEMRQRIDAALGGAGYEYVYLYPGIRKVVQAAGRVIRTPTDRGSVHLIDDRYARRQVRELLPRWWNPALA